MASMQLIGCISDEQNVSVREDQSMTGVGGWGYTFSHTSRNRRNVKSMGFFERTFLSLQMDRLVPDRNLLWRRPRAADTHQANTSCAEANAEVILSS